MTLKGMRRADQQLILDTLGMDRVAGAATTTATTREPVGAPVASGLESGPLGLTVPNFETNTRCVFATPKRRPAPHNFRVVWQV